MELYFSLITYQECRNFMVDLWGPVDNGPFGERFFLPYKFAAGRFTGTETFQRTLVFCIGAFVGNRLVGANMSFNISDQVICSNGILVHEEFRGQGVSDGLLKRLGEIWPERWTYVVGFYKDATSEIFLKKNFSVPHGWGLRKIRKRSLHTFPYEVIFLKKNLRVCDLS